MKLRPFAILSLLLLCATAWCWRGSYRDAQGLVLLLDKGRASGIISTRGVLRFAWTDLLLDDRRAWTIQTFTIPDDQAQVLEEMIVSAPNHSARWKSFSFARGESLGDVRTRHVSVSIPHWLAVALLAILPIRRLLLVWRQWRRQRNNQCLACGYDLRESKDRCPECGAAIKHQLRTLNSEL